jgi:hypothetical protein
MRIRFLAVVPSSNPDFPFRPGQVVEAPRLTPEMRRWLKAGLVEAVKASEEITEPPAHERAVEGNGS